MYIPLSIDHADTNRSSYFLSNRKVVEMVFALIPYFFLIVPLMQGGARIAAIGIVTLCYGFIYIYYFRFRILEENRLRNMVNELDKNKVSGVEHFWQVNRITDDGVIHYVLDSRVGKELGVVVTFDRGSTVGVPEGNFRRFRETKRDFIRELHLQGLDFTWYELPRRQETSPALIHYFNAMTEHPNEDFRKLLKLQIDINNLFVTDAEQPYVDYILIRNHNFRTLRRFRQIVQDVIESTLLMNSYIVNPRLLNKEGVEHFLEDYLTIDALDSSKVRRSVEVKPFDHFAKVTRIVRHDNVEIPVEFIERFDLDVETDYMSIEQIMKRKEEQLNQRLKAWEERKATALERVKQQRLRDVITDAEYREQQNEINAKFEAERLEIIENVDGKQKKKAAKKVKKPQQSAVATETPQEDKVEVESPIVIHMREQMANRLAELKKKEQAAQTVVEEELSIEERLRRQMQSKKRD